MKKNGFTLAEVLITLAIIGVVATLTLPALMTNTGEQQAVTAYKKGINTLTEAAQMNSTLAGFDYGSVTSKSNATNPDPNEQSLLGLLMNRTSVDMQKSGTGITLGDAGASTNFTLFFRDGAALSFNPASQIIKNGGETGSGGVTPDKIQADGLLYGIAAMYDTNGSKGPNVLSNCNAEVTGAINESYGTKITSQADINEKCSKTNRIIRDQFGVRLRGSHAVPNGLAARWAFYN